MGADGDVTVIDVERRTPVFSFAHGKPVLADGKIVGTGGRMLVSLEGESHVQALGLDTIVAQPGCFLKKP